MEHARHRRIHANGIELHVAEAGEGKPVVLIHGFPELWYSWRHQLRVLAEHGYRAVAPDMRGYGDSSAPAEVEAYDVVELCADVLAVLEDIGGERAAIVGHDWGANVAWTFARLYPERTACVAGLSVPLLPRTPAPTVSFMREHMGEDFYVVWFQEPGVADAALARDVRRTILTPEVWTAEWAQRQEFPRLPEWMTEDDLAVYVSAFERTGFTGGLNWYRNMDRNWDLTSGMDDKAIDAPALYIVGTRDSTYGWMPQDPTERAPRLRVEILDGVGHWIQQQSPDEVNAELLALLAEAEWQ